MSKNKPPGQGDQNRGPLTPEETIKALEMAGYSLELDLYRMFRAGKMEATVGPWRQVGDDAQGGAVHAELDLIASLRSDAETLTREHVATSAFSVFVEAKRLHPPSRFVGFLGEQLLPKVEATWRAHFAGLPAAGIGTLDLAHPIGNFFADTGVLDSVVSLLGKPICAHWSVVERSGKGVHARGDDEFFKDMRQLVAARVHQSRKMSVHLLRTKGLPVIHQIQLMMVVGTDTLLTYDTDSRTLTETDHLVVLKGFPVGEEAFPALIDVVTPKAVPALVARYVEAANRQRVALADSRETLHPLLNALRDRYGMWLLENTPRFAG